MPVIHIAPDIDYLFPATQDAAKALCGRLVQEILAAGEFVGIKESLNPTCDVCQQCRQATEAHAL